MPSRCEAGTTALTAWCAVSCKKNPTTKRSLHTKRFAFYLKRAWGKVTPHSGAKAKKSDWNDGVICWRRTRGQTASSPQYLLPSKGTHDISATTRTGICTAHVGCAHAPMCAKIPCYMLFMPQQTEFVCMVVKKTDGHLDPWRDRLAKKTIFPDLILQDTCLV